MATKGTVHTIIRDGDGTLVHQQRHEVDDVHAVRDALPEPMSAEHTTPGEPAASMEAPRKPARKRASRRRSS